MRMRISPGSLWLAYDVVRPKAIQQQLPPQLQLASSPLFADSADRQPKLLFNAYAVDSRWMRGHRVDVQVLARHRRRGTLHLVVLDCVSDTLLWDPENGVRMPNAGRTWLDPRGARYVFDMRAAARPREPLLAVRGAKARALTRVGKQFAVDANRACYFGTHEAAFAMNFDEISVGRPVRRLVGVQAHNALWRDFRGEAPSHAFIHEHAMDFDVDVSGHRYSIRWKR